MQKRAVALGLFDGVHLGHRAVLRAAADAAAKNGLLPAVYTFADEMAGKTGEYLYPPAQRAELFRACGVGLTISAPFARVRDLSGAAFAEKLVREEYVAYVCCGRNFRFGKGAAWNADDLRAFGEIYGFGVTVVPDVEADGIKVSSTVIRQLLKEGRTEQADRLLGEPYCILQTVRHGAELGRTIGFPTINQPFRQGQLVPKHGVYVSETVTPDGRHFPSLTNIGMKPTVHYHGLPLAETYLDGFSGSLYNKTVCVYLHRFLREERKFDSVEALTAQMQDDLRMCREFSKGCHGLNT